ncbi:hypothetical protein FB107DRAFT_288539 [Schizophyllum commune]
MGPHRTQRAKAIDYLLSEGHRGRNPGPPRPVRKARELGIQSEIPDRIRLFDATSTNQDAPQFEADYWNHLCTLADVDKLYKIIRGYNTDSEPHGINIEYTLTQGSSASIPSTIIDAMLVSLIINTCAIDKITREQFIAFLKVLDAPYLVRLRLHLAGRSKREWDEIIFDFIRRAQGALTHLCLELSFCNKPALERYLKSSAASHLESLELIATSDIFEQVVKALQDDDSVRLPNLKHLCLKIKGVNVKTLVAALEKRYEPGVTPALRVELKNDIDDAVRAKACDMGITFDKPCPMRFGS